MASKGEEHSGTAESAGDSNKNDIVEDSSSKSKPVVDDPELDAILDSKLVKKAFKL